MKVTGKDVYRLGTVLSLLSFTSLLVMKFCFRVNIPNDSLKVLGFIQLILCLFYIKKENYK